MHTIDFILGIFVAVIAISVLSPTIASATIETRPRLLSGNALALAVEAMQNETKDFGTLPEAEDRKVVWIVRVPITAYASVPEQTDDTPFIAASGKHVFDGMVAANFLPLGTRVRIPELYGDKIFIVEDRMNKRYWYRVDIWMADNADAKRFGLKVVNVEILES